MGRQPPCAYWLIANKLVYASCRCVLRLRVCNLIAGSCVAWGFVLSTLCGYAKLKLMGLCWLTNQSNVALVIFTLRELLLIRRAKGEGDARSGQIAYTGGRLKQGGDASWLCS